MAFDDPNRDVFRRALDEACRVPQMQRQETERQERGGPNTGSSLGVCFDFAPAGGGGGGGEARWDLAMEWANEPSTFRAPMAPKLPSNPAPASSELAEAVTRELDFCAGLPAKALTERWRAFVWRNHPDRQPSAARERANARVAVANALYDRARRALRPA
jgi:hypothetical protein